MRVQALLAAGIKVVCTDLRTAAEWKVARDLGATLWLIERPGAGAPGAMASHTTEREAASADRTRFDTVLRNDDTLEALSHRVEHAIARMG